MINLLDWEYPEPELKKKFVGDSTWRLHNVGNKVDC